MVCEQCNAKIKDGLDFCQECGAPVQEAVIITCMDDIPLDAQPFVNLVEYVKCLTTNIYSLMALVGAICLYLSPFMTWSYGNIGGEKVKADLFDIGNQYGDLALNKPIITILGILILFCGVIMMAMAGRTGIRPLKKYADIVIIRFIPGAMAIILFVVQLMNKSYKVQRELYQVDIFNCLGPMILIIGVVIYTVSIIMEKNSKR